MTDRLRALALASFAATLAAALLDLATVEPRLYAHRPSVALGLLAIALLHVLVLRAPGLALALWATGPVAYASWTSSSAACSLRSTSWI